MATTDKNKITEAAHIRNVRHHNSALQGLTDNQIDALIEQGSLQASSVFENALSQASDGLYTVVGKDTHDFSNYDDGKTITTRRRSRFSSYSAPVKKFKNKVGGLRIQCWERALNRFYYFYIPYSVHSQVTNIEIPFDRDGTPSRQNNAVINWWDYEVKTFEDLAKITVNPVAQRSQRNQDKFKQLFSLNTHTGGKIPGKLSMTPNAIRKRAQRAAKREA